MGTSITGHCVALALDWENWWALSSPDHRTLVDYPELVQRWYMALHRQNIAVDIVHPGHDLSGYSLVVVPHAYLLSDQAIARLGDLVGSGGHVLTAAYTDVVDETAGFRAGGYMRGLGGILGIDVEDFEALLPRTCGSSDDPRSSPRVDTSFGNFRAQVLIDAIRVVDPGVIIEGEITDGRFAGFAAATSRYDASGGSATHIATMPDDEGMQAITEMMTQRAGVEPVLRTPHPRVEAMRRGVVLTVINHGDTTVDVDVVGRDLRSGEHTDGVRLAPFGWSMLRLAD